MVDEKKPEEQQPPIEAEVVSERQLVRQDGPRDPVRVEQKLDVDAVVEQVNAVKDLLSRTMEDGLHYGKIPGSGKNAKATLLKPGAELLCVLFRLSPELKITRTDHEAGHREYEVVTTLVQNTTGRVFGQGVGSCTTKEKKYAWRKTELTCPDCGYAPVRKSKHKDEFYCWKNKGGCGNTWDLKDDTIAGQIQESKPNPDLADTYNTVLKMAKKRSLVDACLTSTAASFLFTQDVDDTDKGGKGYDPAQGSGAPEDDAPDPKSENPAPAQERGQERPRAASSNKVAPNKADSPKPKGPRAMTGDEVKRGLLLFESYGAGLEALEGHLGKPCDEWTTEDAKLIKALHESLQSGVDPRSYFPKSALTEPVPEPGSRE